MKRKKNVLFFILVIVLLCLGGCKSTEIKNAETCVQLEQYNKALEHLAIETNNNADNDYAYLLKGEVLIKLKKYKEAKKAFAYSLKLREESKKDISTFCMQTAKEKIKIVNLPTQEILLLLEYAKKVNPQSLEQQKPLLKEFGMIRLNEFSDIQNSCVFLLYLCKMDKQYEKSTGDILYEFGKKSSKNDKIIAFSGALKFNQEHRQEMALFIIKTAQSKTDTSLYNFIKKECQKYKSLSLNKELFEAKKTIVNRLLLRAKRARYNDYRDIARTKKIFTALFAITTPDQPYQRKYLFIKTEESKQMTIPPFTLSQKILCRNYVTYTIKTNKPIYVIVSGYYGTHKIKFVKHKYIFSEFCPSPQKLTFLSTDNADIKIMRK